MLRHLQCPGERASDVPCNDTASCPDETTCCSTPDGEWACCPAPNAVCCSDHIHCCPHGTTCDLVQETCVESSNSLTTPMSWKMPAITTAAPSAPAEIQVTEPALGERASDVPCNDTVACPDETTCCSTPDGEWACCPEPNATCCRDGKHCCPHGYKCGHRKQSCVKDEVEIPWYTRTPALSIPKQQLSGLY
uniref:Granulin a n=1 Tax=Neogobius melanostomus TaxID=47308 RepID=A0A8C6UTW7_9GOBI